MGAPSRGQHRRLPIERIVARAFRIPTERPESDGTLEWDATTIVIVEASAGPVVGIGYTYTDAAAAGFVSDTLAPEVIGRDAMAIDASWWAMLHRVRNVGRRGLAACAISGVDAALWDLKARLLDLPLATLLGPVRERVPVYGSGGFTSLSIAELRQQLDGWVADGLRAVKMKVGSHPDDDPERVAEARDAVGPDVELMVDANGAYDRKNALAMAEAFAASRVSWLEEPVSSDDLDGLRLIRDRAPAGMEIAAGEYAYDAFDFRRLLEAGAVDCLQADATRCLGITGFLAAGALCDGWNVPLSSHTAPALHLHPGVSVHAVRHLEYFHDHIRIERMLFDGVPEPIDGQLAPALDRPGLGIELRDPASVPGLEALA